VSFRSSISYYYTDELGTFIIGGSDKTPSFRGFIGQMDIYRRIALKPEQVRIYFPNQNNVNLHSSYQKNFIYLYPHFYQQSFLNQMNVYIIVLLLINVVNKLIY
jgi:hypothetical protein